jgi:hypothetical protein
MQLDHHAQVAREEIAQEVAHELHARLMEAHGRKVSIGGHPVFGASGGAEIVARLTGTDFLLSLARALEDGAVTMWGPAAQDFLTNHRDQVRAFVTDKAWKFIEDAAASMQTHPVFGAALKGNGG